MDNRQKVDELLRSDVFNKLSKIEKLLLSSYIEGMITGAEIREHETAKEDKPA